MSPGVCSVTEEFSLSGVHFEDASKNFIGS